ncbi:hypothetical protein QQ045_029182 [Rhodiola kirilowii]
MALNPRPLSSSFHTLSHNKWPQPPEDQSKLLVMERKVPVVYYLSRNGQFEHPHFLEVPLSSDGLYLRADVIERLNQIRGKNMASMYSWSSKRSYKNGYVWQDLSGDDFIHPSHGHEYILKGSELLNLDTSSSFRHHHLDDTNTNNTALTPTSDKLIKISKPSSQMRSSSGEYMVYKLPGAAAYSLSRRGGNAAADMATQTGEDDRIGRRLMKCVVDGFATELMREEVSPPSSISSTDTLGKGEVGSIEERAVGMSGRLRVSETLMQLIACGSRSVRDCVSTKSEVDMGTRDQGRRLSVDAQDRFA